MKRKDFSAISSLLTENGVGTLKLLFRTNLTMDDEIDLIGEKDQETIKENPDLIIDFSDGKKYLGSLILKTAEVANILGSNPYEGEEGFVIDNLIPEKKFHTRALFFRFLRFAPSQNTGECIIFEEDFFEEGD